MKTQVEVWLVARTCVKMTVEHEDGESPTDITDDEADHAVTLAESHGVEWNIQAVTLAESHGVEWDIERVKR